MISDKGHMRSLVQAYLHCRLDYCNVILAGTAGIVIKRLQSLQNTAARLVSGTIFRGHYHYSTQPPLASGVAQNRFQEHSPVSIYELCLRSLLANNFRGRPWLQASTGYPVPKVHMLIRQRRFAFYEPIVWNSLLCVTVACH